MRNTLQQKHPHHVETRQPICLANQLTGFYMIRTITERHFREVATIKIRINPKNQKLTWSVLWWQKVMQTKQIHSRSSIV